MASNVRFVDNSDVILRRVESNSQAAMKAVSEMLVEAVEEFITIARAAKVRGVISHHKAAYAKNHGNVKTTLPMMETANAEGCDIYCDVYPYTASKTSLSSRFIPKEYINSHLPEYL